MWYGFLAPCRAKAVVLIATKPVILIGPIFEKAARLGERKRQEKAVGVKGSCSMPGNVGSLFGATGDSMVRAWPSHLISRPRDSTNIPALFAVEGDHVEEASAIVI